MGFRAWGSGNVSKVLDIWTATLNPKQLYMALRNATAMSPDARRGAGDVEGMWFIVGCLSPRALRASLTPRACIT